MLRFEEALARILALGAPVLSSEVVPLEDAEGRVLAEDLVAPVDLPAFDYSAMDGYAVRTRDLDDAGAPPFRLPVRGESRTGALPGPLEAGATMRIFTGAAIPAGADAVIMQENVARDGDVAVLAQRPRPGQNVRRRGEDLAVGTMAIPRGTRLRPAHLSLAGAIDRAEVSVVKRPIVTILATGDELRRPGTDALPGTIPESNTVALRAMARRAGATTRAHPYVRDDRAATERAFAAALDTSDVVVTIGGVSVGDHDLVRPALEAVGVQLDFWRVAIKPGKPLAFGRRGGVTVLGLPGNPVSAMVTFVLFAAPLLRALAGDRSPLPPRRRVRLGQAIAHAPGRTELVRARLSRERDDAPVTALPVASQASGSVVSIAGADALIVVPQSSEGLVAGAEVDVIPLGVDV